MGVIPKSFQCGPYTVSVLIVSKGQMEAAQTEPLKEGEDAPLGLWTRDDHTIRVQKVRKGYTPTAQLHTFWHEFMHAVLELMAHDDLSTDEQFVDRMGLALCQAHLSFEI